jgi:hypothetical protein
VNSFSQSYDAKFLFIAPQKRQALYLNYGYRSFLELPANRSSQHTADIVSYCIQGISWVHNGSFCAIVDGQGNISLVSRLGEMAFIKNKHATKVHFLMNSFDGSNKVCFYHFVNMLDI